MGMFDDLAKLDDHIANFKQGGQNDLSMLPRNRFDYGRQAVLGPVQSGVYSRVKRHYEGEGSGQNDSTGHEGDTLLTPPGMPSLTDADRRTAARKSQAMLRARGGRASTILTDDPLGGGL